MEQELVRLATFHNWPQDAEGHSLTLARHGFHYTGEGDRVACSLCSIQLDRWRWTDDPGEKHRVLSPTCKFANDPTASEIQLERTPRSIGGRTASDDPGGRDGGTIEDIYASVMRRAERKGLLKNNSDNNNTSNEPIDYDRLRCEAARYDTFYNWPRDANADPRALAREGLFYTGSGDRVQCVFCKGCFRRWEREDVPADEHRRHFPRCPFVLGLDVGNIADSSDPTIDSGSNESRSIEREIRADSTSAKNEELASNFESQEPPKIPKFSKLSDRIRSFEGGTIPLGKTAKSLAEAGWFYVGPGDKVQCFQCGGNLRDWEPEDDPWDEHRRWYKHCTHLKTQKPTMMPRIEATMKSDAVRFRIEPREIKARMDTPIVRAILDMGYDSSLIRQVIENQLMTTGDDFRNAESLLEAIFALEDPVPPPTNGTPTSSTFTNDHSIARDSISTATSSRIEIEARNTLSPESSSNRSTSSEAMGQCQLSQLHSLTPVKPPHFINSTNNFFSLDPNPSRIHSNASSAASVAKPTEHSKSKGKRKKNKKKNSVAAATKTQEHRTRVQSETAVNKEILKEEGIDEEEILEYFEENRRLRELRMCKVCMDAEVNTVFLPCGHLVCCSTCSPLLKDCPMCRTYIRGTVKTFLN